MSENLSQVALKKHVSHDGKTQWVCQEGVFTSESGLVYDMLICSWCGTVPFLYDRKSLMKCLRGTDGRRMPNCGCQKLDVAGITRDYQTDMRLKDIARKYGVSQTTVRRAARDSGILRKPPKSTTKEVTDYQIISRILLTASTSQVATQMKISVGRVRKAINRHMTLITVRPKDSSLWQGLPVPPEKS